jgi:hypothetical protein
MLAAVVHGLLPETSQELGTVLDASETPGAAPSTEHAASVVSPPVPDPSLRSGVRTIRVRTRTGERAAQIAPSCLVSPAPGDRVLVVHAGDEAYVLAVVRSSEERATSIVFRRDVSVTVEGGNLRVCAEGLELASPRLRIACALVDLVGEVVHAKTKNVRVVAEAIDTLAGRVYQRAVNFLRRTEEVDRVEARVIDRKARSLARTHGENVVTSAEQLVKIDATQVHVG